MRGRDFKRGRRAGAEYYHLVSRTEFHSGAGPFIPSILTPLPQFFLRFIHPQPTSSHPPIHLTTHPPIHLPTHLSLHSFIYSSSHSSTRPPCLPSFLSSFIHLFTDSIKALNAEQREKGRNRAEGREREGRGKREGRERREMDERGKREGREMETMGLDSLISHRRGHQDPAAVNRRTLNWTNADRAISS